MAPTKRSNRPALLSHSRPRIAKRQLTSSPASLSSKATRNLIRSHHQLLKAREQAVLSGDVGAITKIDAQITANGGLESYQLASKTGQSRERGGDSSTVFLDWIRPVLRQLKQLQDLSSSSSSSSSSCPPKMRLLEVGALSTKNACSQHPCIDVTRIDLNSQEPGILQQDFMQRPIPTDDQDRFHAISLSLVLNYVPSAAQRGEMLRRCSAFLTLSLLSSVLSSTTTTTATATTTTTTSIADGGTENRKKDGFRPYLFLVLPAACVTNSRYFNADRLRDIATSLGYSKLEEKITNKLIYQLWEYAPQGKSSSNKNNKAIVFRKEELNPGKIRNNFTITLNASHG